MKNIFNIGVVGLGNIGSYFCNLLISKKKEIELKTGKIVNLKFVSAKSPKKKRKFKYKKKSKFYFYTSFITNV